MKVKACLKFTCAGTYNEAEGGLKGCGIMAIWRPVCIIYCSFYSTLKGRFLLQPFHPYLVSTVVPGQPRQSLPVQLSVSIPLLKAHLFTVEVHAFRQTKVCILDTSGQIMPNVPPSGCDVSEGDGAGRN